MKIIRADVRERFRQVVARAVAKIEAESHVLAPNRLKRRSDIGLLTTPGQRTPTPFVPRRSGPLGWNDDEGR